MGAAYLNSSCLRVELIHSPENMKSSYGVSNPQISIDFTTGQKIAGKIDFWNTTFQSIFQIYREVFLSIPMLGHI